MLHLWQQLTLIFLFSCCRLQKELMELMVRMAWY